MVLQDRHLQGQLSEDVETVALAACAAFGKLNPSAPSMKPAKSFTPRARRPTAAAVAAASRVFAAGGARGYDRLAEATDSHDQRRNDRRESVRPRGQVRRPPGSPLARATGCGC